jgi:hypothetical protein
MRDQQQQGDQ